MCAFDNGYSPCSRLVEDALDNRLAGIGVAEGILGEWGMEVDKGRYLDSVTARQALSWSKIAAATRLGIALGNTSCKAFIETLNRVGITPPARNPNSTEARPQYYPRVYLGTEPMSLREMVMAYTVFPNTGKRPIAPYIVSKVTDSNGNLLWENPLAAANRMVNSTSPCTAYRLHSIMQESLRKGAAVRVLPHLPLDFKGAVKTGTNYDFSDNTLIGYNAGFTCGVWIGFLNDHQPIYPNAFSSDTCSPVLGAVFHAASGRYNEGAIPMPSDTEEVEICTSSGQLATNFCFETVVKDGKVGYARPTYREYFPKGDVSLGVCSVHGDGSPSLGDFLELGSARMNSSRVLPVVPILPQGGALIGTDPYECDTSLNPRYRNADELAQSVGGTDVEPVHGDDLAEETEEPISSSTLTLPAPEPLRIIPIAPLQF